MNDQTSFAKPLQRETGTALIELSLVAPVLLFLFFATWEIHRGISARHHAELFSQETATAVFHECKDKDLSDGFAYSPAQAQTCLQRELDARLKAFRNVHSRTAVVGTIYRPGAGGLEVYAGPVSSCFASVPPAADFSCNTQVSRFTLERANSELLTLGNMAGWIVVIETFLREEMVQGYFSGSLQCSSTGEGPSYFTWLSLLSGICCVLNRALAKIYSATGGKK